MGGGDHHHHEPSIKIPDWRIYRVENSPELMRVQKSLASCGLKDPWLRNEVWKYTEFKEYAPGRYLYHLFRRGFKWGLGAAIITTVIEKTFFSHGHPHRYFPEPETQEEPDECAR